MDFRWPAVVNVLVFLVLVIPVWYLATYMPLRDSDKYRQGRAFSRNFQGALVGNALMISAFYFLLPAICWGMPPMQGFADFNAGVLTLATAVCGYLTLKFYDPVGRRHFRLQVVARLLAGMGLTIDAVFWLFGRQSPCCVRIFFFVIAMIVIVFGEFVFLKKNKWRFLPSHPR